RPVATSKPASAGPKARDKVVVVVRATDLVAYTRAGRSAFQIVSKEAQTGACVSPIFSVKAGTLNCPYTVSSNMPLMVVPLPLLCWVTAERGVPFSRARPQAKASSPPASFGGFGDQPHG